MLSLIQCGLNTSDMAASLRLYSEAFGFRNAGGQGIWGSTIAVQGLPPESRALMWWMVGAQPFFQLEFFQHTNPVQRPLRDDWRPSDLGWVRIGLTVADFDHSVAAIAANGLKLHSPATGRTGDRRAALHDPHVGCMIEIREAAGTAGPALIYATSSVSDLTAAESYYRDVLGFPLTDLSALHEPDDEALWGLAGARREGFIVDAGSALLEIVRYDDPVGRPRRADWRASDQGLSNVAFGAREKRPIAEVLARLEAKGVPLAGRFETDELLAAYVTDAERETEFAVIPHAWEAALGFAPAAPFFG